MPKHGVRLTPEQKAAAQDLFIDSFRGSANITAGCRAAAVNRSTFYQWKEDDAAFLVRYKQAEEEASDVLLAAAWQRAVLGVPHTVTSMGKVVYVDGPGGKLIPLVEREYSDALLSRLLQAHNAKFRDRSHVDVTSGGEQLSAVSTLVMDLLLTVEGEQDALNAVHTVATRKHRPPRG